LIHFYKSFKCRKEDDPICPGGRLKGLQ